MCTVRDVLMDLNLTRTVVLSDLNGIPLEEGIVGGLLDESLYLDHPAVYTENDFPFYIVVGIAL